MCGNVITVYECLDCSKEHSRGKEAKICDVALRIGKGFGKGCLKDKDRKVYQSKGRCKRCAGIHQQEKEEEERRAKKKRYEEKIQWENKKAKRQQRERLEEEEHTARENGDDDDDYGYFSSVLIARR